MAKRSSGRNTRGTYLGATSQIKGVYIEPTNNFDINMKAVSSHISTALSIFEGHIFAICTILAIMFLILILPDFSHKSHPNKKLREVQNVWDKIPKEVTRAEVACVTAAEHVYHIQHAQHAMRDGTTETKYGPQEFLGYTSAKISATKSAPAGISNKVGYFCKALFKPDKNSSHKEITLMSYIYTDSFNNGKQAYETTTVIADT